MKKIPLTDKGFALVDDEDFENISKFNWCVSANRYAMRGTFKNGKHEGILMHRQIIGAKKGQEVDHIDRNGFNNQKNNLRICTRSENIINTGMLRNNTSGVKGVHFVKNAKMWIAYIEKDRKRRYLGYFKEKQEAVDCRKNAEEQFYAKSRTRESPEQCFKD